MAEPVRMPKLGDTADTVLVIGWLVKEGQTVAAGEALMEVETNKVETEVTSPLGGTVRSLDVPEGEEVAVGTVICTVEPA